MDLSCSDDEIIDEEIISMLLIIYACICLYLYNYFNISNNNTI